jgi:hypothetical protein
MQDDFRFPNMDFPQPLRCGTGLIFEVNTFYGAVKVVNWQEGQRGVD